MRIRTIERLMRQNRVAGKTLGGEKAMCKLSIGRRSKKLRINPKRELSTLSARRRIGHPALPNAYTTGGVGENGPGDFDKGSVSRKKKVCSQFTS